MPNRRQLFILRETVTHPARPTYTYIERHVDWRTARHRAAMLLMEARNVDGLVLRQTRRTRWCTVGPDAATYIIEVL